MHLRFNLRFEIWDFTIRQSSYWIENWFHKFYSLKNTKNSLYSLNCYSCYSSSIKCCIFLTIFIAKSKGIEYTYRVKCLISHASSPDSKRRLVMIPSIVTKMFNSFHCHMKLWFQFFWFEFLGLEHYNFSGTNNGTMQWPFVVYEDCRLYYKKCNNQHVIYTKGLPHIMSSAKGGGG